MRPAANNAFFGSSAGAVNTSGGQNTFVGGNAGNTNTTGSSNTFLGFNSGSASGTSNTFVGASSDGSGSSNTVIGVSASSTGNSAVVVGAGASNEGNNNTAIGSGASVERFDPGSPAPTFATAVGAGAVANLSNTVVLGRSGDVVKVPGTLSVSGDVFASDITASTLTVTGGVLKLTALPFATNSGNKPLCRNANSVVSTCLNLTDSFTSESKQQNAQIAEQAEQLKRMQTQVEDLKKIVCAMNPKAELCSIGR